MSIKPQLAWHLQFDNQQQFLYYAERPRGTFKEGQKEPEWNKIQVEMPTRIMDATQEWLDSKSGIDVILERKDQIRNRIVNSWGLKQAVIEKSYIRKSRHMDTHIRFAIISYKEAAHANL